MKLKLLSVTAALVSMALAAQAHDQKGKNGGQLVDAGNYHVEAVVQDRSLIIYLHDQQNKALSTSGFKGTAILVVGGKQTRIPLLPTGENQLSGMAAVDLKAPIKGAVQITDKANATVQAKF